MANQVVYRGENSDNQRKNKNVFTKDDLNKTNFMKKQKDLSDRALYYNSVEGMSYSDSMRQAQKDQNINQLTGNSSNTNGLSRSNSFVNSLRQGVKDPHKVLKEQTKQQKQQQIQKNQKREMENDDMERW